MKVSINTNHETSIKTYLGSIRIDNILFLFTITSTDDGSRITNKIDWDEDYKPDFEDQLAVELKILGKFSKTLTNSINFEI